MPKFNEFIKGFEEKETATKPQEPKVEPAPKTGEPQGKEQAQPKPSKEPMPFGMKKRMEDEVSVHNGQQPKGGQQMPKKDYSHLDDRELYAQINLAENEEEYNDLLAEKERRWQESKKNQPKPNKQEEPNSLEYEGYRLEKTPDGKWINRDTYEYFDTKVEAQKDIDKFISAQSPNKPKEAEKPAPQKDDEKGQRIVNYGGKDMTFEEAKEQYKKAVAIPTLKSTPEREAYLDKSAEYDIAQDELYKKWYEEKDPQKKAELKEQMDTLDKEYARFLDEWEEAERNRYKKTR